MRIEILDGQTVINTISADEAFAEQHYPGAWRLAEQQDEPAAPAPEPHHISIGAFFDRFGAQKYPILASPDPMVQALIKDCTVRTFIDLDRADLSMGLQMLVQAGFAIDPEAVLTAPILDNERP